MADEPVDGAQKRRPPLEAIVPLPLRNWQVIDHRDELPPIEIDGEATVVDVQSRTPVDTTLAPDAEETPVAAPTIQAADQMDERIVVSLDTRQQQIEAGATATYQVTLLNNGPQRALFTLTIAENRLAPWLAAPIPGVVLHPGERTTVTVALTPPKAAVSRAGDYRLTFLVSADEYPDRQSQVAVTLTIVPFVDLKVGKVVVPRRTLTWWRRTVTVTAPIINRGNHPTTVLLRAEDGADACHVTFHAPGLRQTRAQQARVTIPPGRMLPVTLQVYATSQSWFGRTRRTCPLTLTVAAKATPTVEQTALVKLALAPVIGPWQVATLLGLLSFVVTGLGLGGLAIVIALIVNLAQPATPAQSLSTMAPAPSIVTILVQTAPVNAQSGTTALAPSPINAPQAVVSPATLAPPEARDPAVPLVQPEQISAPATGLTPQNAVAVAPHTGAAQPVAAIQPAASAPAPMTYARMFQEIGLRYDLNWRMLAAQAYVESSFDSLALGSHGDLGLMQIQPPTWREWAPTVAASDPFDSYSNVLVAAAYLDYLRTMLAKQGHPEREWMLVAYNWGPDKVAQHLENGGSWDDLAPERRQYVEDILRLAETIPPDAAF